jgi:hypothetical protein
MCTNGVPVEIQTPTHLNVMTVLPPVLSPKNILRPPFSHFSLISEKKFWQDFYLTFLPLQNCVCWVVHVIWMNYSHRRGSGGYFAVSYQGSQGSIPDQSVCDLWLAEWQGIRFCCL